MIDNGWTPPSTDTPVKPTDNSTSNGSGWTPPATDTPVGQDVKKKDVSPNGTQNSDNGSSAVQNINPAPEDHFAGTILAKQPPDLTPTIQQPYVWSPTLEQNSSNPTVQPLNFDNPNDMKDFLNKQYATQSAKSAIYGNNSNPQVNQQLDNDLLHNPDVATDNIVKGYLAANPDVKNDLSNPFADYQVKMDAYNANLKKLNDDILTAQNNDQLGVAQHLTDRYNQLVKLQSGLINQTQYAPVKEQQDKQKQADADYANQNSITGALSAGLKTANNNLFNLGKNLLGAANHLQRLVGLPTDPYVDKITNIPDEYEPMTVPTQGKLIDPQTGQVQVTGIIPAFMGMIPQLVALGGAGKAGEAALNIAGATEAGLPEELAAQQGLLNAPKVLTPEAAKQLGLVIGGTALGFNENYNAINNAAPNLPEYEKNFYAFNTGALSMLPFVATDAPIIKQLEGLSSLGKDAVPAAEKYADLLGQGSSRSEAFKASVMPMLKAQAQNSLAMSASNMANKISQQAVNLDTGQNTFNTSISPKEIFNNLVTSMITSSPFTAMTGLEGYNGRNQGYNEALLSAGKDPNDFTNQLLEKLNKGEISQNAYNNAVDKIVSAGVIYPTLSDSYSDKQKSEILVSAIQKNGIQKKIDSANKISPTLAQPLEEQKEAIDKKIDETANPEIKDKNIDEEIKNIYNQKPNNNAVQEQSTSSVLQHPQETTTEAGSERSRVESGEQGNETTKTGSEKEKVESITYEDFNKQRIELDDIHNGLARAYLSRQQEFLNEQRANGTYKLGRTAEEIEKEDPELQSIKANMAKTETAMDELGKRPLIENNTTNGNTTQTGVAETLPQTTESTQSESPTGQTENKGTKTGEKVTEPITEDYAIQKLKDAGINISINRAMSGSVYIHTDGGTIRISNHPENTTKRLPSEYEPKNKEDIDKIIPEILSKQKEQQSIQKGTIITEPLKNQKFEVVKVYDDKRIGGNIRVKRLSDGKEFDTYKSLYKSETKVTEPIEQNVPRENTPIIHEYNGVKYQLETDVNGKITKATELYEDGKPIEDSEAKGATLKKIAKDYKDKPQQAQNKGTNTGEKVTEPIKSNIESDIKKSTDFNDFISKEHEIPISDIDPYVTRDVIEKKLGKIESRTPDAPVIATIEDGKFRILDGAQRYYQKLDKGDTTIKVRFHPSETEGAKIFYDKIKNTPEKVTEPIKEPYITKSGKQTVELKDGELNITDKEGNEPSDKTKRKAMYEYAQNLDMNSGEIAPKPSEGLTPKQVHDFIAEHSNNPAEIAYEYQTTKGDIPEKDYKETIIAENIGKVKQSSFEDFNDPNNVTAKLKKTYLRDNGDSLDTLAKEISERHEIDVTPEDIANFMLKYEGGTKDFNKEKESPESIQLSEKFRNLTGLDLTKPKILEEGLKQYKENGKHLSEHQNADEPNTSTEEWQSILKTDIRKTINESIGDGTITTERAKSFVENSEPSEIAGSEPIIKTIESQANSNNEAELNQAIKGADEIISNRTNFETTNPNAEGNTGRATEGQPRSESTTSPPGEVLSENEKAIGDHLINRYEGNRNLINKAIDRQPEEILPDKDGLKSYVDGKLPPPETPKGETENTEPEKTTGIKNSITDVERKKLGLDDRIKPIEETNKEVWDRAMERLNENQNLPEEIIAKFKKDKQALSDEDVMILGYHIARTEKQIENAENEIRTARKAGDDETADAKQAPLAALRDKAQDVFDVMAATGGVSAKALQVRNILIKQDYTLAAMTRKMEASLGGRDLTPEEKTKLEKQYNDIKDANDKLEKRVQELENQVKDLQEHHDKNYTEKAKTLANKIRGLKSQPLILKDAHGNPIVVKESGLHDVINQAIELVAKGVEEGGKLADAITKGLEHLRAENFYKNLSDEDKKAIDKQFADNFKGLSDEDKRLQAYKNTVKNKTEKINEQVKKGNPETAKKDALKLDDEAKKLQFELEQAQNALKKLRDEKGVTDRKRIDALNNNLQKRIDDINQRIRDNKLERKSIPEMRLVNKDTIRLEAELNKAKNNFEKSLVENRQKNRSTYKKILDKTLDVIRFNKLLSPLTLARITSTTGWNLGERPILAALRSGILAPLPKAWKEAAQKNLIGGFNLRREASVFAKSMTQGIRDIGNNDLKNALSSGKEKTLGELPQGLASIMGRVHAALYKPAVRNSFERNMANLYSYYAKKGIPIDNTIARQILTDAYTGAMNENYQGDNMVNDMFKLVTNYLERSGKFGQGVSFTTKATVANFVKIPSNIAKEGGIRTFGLLSGLGKAVANTVDYTLKREDIPDKDKAIVIDHLSKGLWGAALFTLGALNAKNTGGYDDKDWYKKGTIKVGNFTIPAIFVSNPLFVPYQLGATFMHLLHKHNETNLQAGLEALSGYSAQLPLSSSMIDDAHTLGGKQGAIKYLDELAKNTFDPAAAQYIRKFTDEYKRMPDTKDNLHSIWQGIETGLPGLSQNVQPHGKDNRTLFEKATSSAPLK